MIVKNSHLIMVQLKSDTHFLQIYNNLVPFEISEIVIHGKSTSLIHFEFTSENVQ